VIDGDEILFKSLRTVQPYKEIERFVAEDKGVASYFLLAVLECPGLDRIFSIEFAIRDAKSSQQLSLGLIAQLFHRCAMRVY